MAIFSLFKKIWKSASINNLRDLVVNPEKCLFVFILLFILEIFVNCFVIQNIKYTEIDWKAYMQEVEGFLNGTTDYNLLKGDTGPLVYPAGFVYIFSGLYYLTNRGVHLRLAQYIFAGLYQLTLLSIFYIYYKVKKVPPYAFFFMCCASYRIHSIYVLRLFNDPVAMTIFYMSVCCMLSHRWTLACVFFSISVSVKMNLLLFAPALLLLLLARFSLLHTILHLSLCATIQVLLATPFLLTNPIGYMHRAFEFSRQFLFKWTVNWRFLEEETFLDRRFHLLLLFLHLTTLSAFFYFYWIRRYGGVITYISQLFSPWCHTLQLNNNLTNRNEATSKTTLNNDKTETSAINSSLLTPDNIVTLLFASNFIGMAFSRSLHYQFYVWYFHTLHHLLWTLHLSSPLRLVFLGLIEMSWNTYPSTDFSSANLHFCHFIILAALFTAVIFPTKKSTVEAIKIEEKDGKIVKEKAIKNINSKHVKKIN